MKDELAWIHSFNDVTATITKQRVHVLNLASVLPVCAPVQSATDHDKENCPIEYDEQQTAQPGSPFLQT